MQGQDSLLRYKSDFPSFDYTHPRHDVLNLLYVHLTGRECLWFESYIHSLRGEFHWALFVEAVCNRFGDSGVSLMEDFATLKQRGVVDDFTDEYEMFKSLILQSYPYLTENYFMDNYVARLKPSLRCVCEDC